MENRRWVGWISDGDRLCSRHGKIGTDDDRVIAVGRIAGSADNDRMGPIVNGIALPSSDRPKVSRCNDVVGAAAYGCRETSQDLVAKTSTDKIICIGAEADQSTEIIGINQIIGPAGDRGQ